MSEQDPVSREEAEGLLASLRGAGRVLAAVSGGPDSLALLLLVARWRGPGRPEILAATVDHGLRPEAADEARLAARAASVLGVPHRILAWGGEKPRSGLQAAARRARYGLLRGLAGEVGATHLLTAHTLDDQAETVLLRLAGGSGLAGLAAMRPTVESAGLVHARPLLGIPKSRLVATCRAEGLDFADDPSNRDPRFARGRLRAAMPALAREGLTPERLARLARRMARADEALDGVARQALAGAQLGPGTWRGSRFADEPFEVAVRMLEIALPRADGYGPRLERLEALAEALRGALAAGVVLRRTISGRIVSLDPAGRLAVAPESPRRRGRAAPRRPAPEGVAAGVPHSLGKG